MQNHPHNYDYTNRQQKRVSFLNYVAFGKNDYPIYWPQKWIDIFFCACPNGRLPRHFNGVRVAVENIYVSQPLSIDSSLDENVPAKNKHLTKLWNFPHIVRFLKWINECIGSILILSFLLSIFLDKFRSAIKCNFAFLQFTV